MPSLLLWVLMDFLNVLEIVVARDISTNQVYTDTWGTNVRKPGNFFVTSVWRDFTKRSIYSHIWLRDIWVQILILHSNNFFSHYKSLYQNINIIICLLFLVFCLGIFGFLSWIHMCKMFFIFLFILKYVFYYCKV